MKIFTDIMSSYDLLEHFDETVDPDLHKVYKFKDPSNIIAKNVFKDKRLNDLWAKAERAGFSRKIGNFFDIFYLYFLICGKLE